MGESWQSGAVVVPEGSEKAYTDDLGLESGTEIGVPADRNQTMRSKKGTSGSASGADVHELRRRLLPRPPLIVRFGRSSDRTAARVPGQGTGGPTNPGLTVPEGRDAFKRTKALGYHPDKPAVGAEDASGGAKLALTESGTTTLRRAGRLHRHCRSTTFHLQLGRPRRGRQPPRRSRPKSGIDLAPLLNHSRTRSCGGPLVLACVCGPPELYNSTTGFRREHNWKLGRTSACAASPGVVRNRRRSRHHLTPPRARPRDEALSVRGRLAPHS